MTVTPEIERNEKLCNGKVPYSETYYIISVMTYQDKLADSYFLPISQKLLLSSSNQPHCQNSVW